MCNLWKQHEAFRPLPRKAEEVPDPGKHFAGCILPAALQGRGIEPLAFRVKAGLTFREYLAQGFRDGRIMGKGGPEALLVDHDQFRVVFHPDGCRTHRARQQAHLAEKIARPERGHHGGLARGFFHDNVDPAALDDIERVSGVPLPYRDLSRGIGLHDHVVDQFPQFRRGKRREYFHVLHHAPDLFRPALLINMRAFRRDLSDVYVSDRIGYFDPAPFELVPEQIKDLGLDLDMGGKIVYRIPELIGYGKISVRDHADHGRRSFHDARNRRQNFEDRVPHPVRRDGVAYPHRQHSDLDRAGQAEIHHGFAQYLAVRYEHLIMLDGHDFRRAKHDVHHAPLMPGHADPVPLLQRLFKMDGEP